MKARFWFDDKEFDKAIDTYKLDPLAKLDRGDLTNFATAHYFTGKHAEGLPIVEEGIKRFPRHAPFNRLGMFFNYEMGNYDKSLDFADRLFNASDSLKASWMDHFYRGLALQSARSDYDAAISEFTTAMNMEVPASNKLSLIQTLYSAYSAKGDFDNAIKFYNEYLAAKGNPSANDYNSLARMYLKHAEEVPEAEQKQWQMKADQTYGEAIQKFPANAEYLNILRARLNATIDADMSQGLAKPYYEAAAGLLQAKANLEAGEKTRLIECYRYLGWYYNEKGDKAQCQNYWRKVKELDPTNAEADQFLQ
jgi:tetratricopeptide (TPR) repeat protein